MVFGFGESCLCDEDGGEICVGGRRAGVKLDGFLSVYKGGVEAAETREEIGKIGVNVGRLGSKTEGAVEMVEGLVCFPFFDEGQSIVAVKDGNVWAAGEEMLIKTEG